MAGYQSYFICTSPRSGSTLLCGLLAATGKSGMPDSHFHSPSVVDWAGYYKLSLDGYTSEGDLLAAIFLAARDRGTGNTGIFGLRLQRASFEFFLQKLKVLCKTCSADSDAERVRNVFGNTLFIHLARENKLDQAISLVKAKQTGLWHKAPDGTEAGRTALAQEPVYDAHAIAGHVAELTDMEASWNSWFDGQQLQPLCISYDQLSDAPAEVLAMILGHLDIDPGIAHGIALPVAKLADATNRQWAKRFSRQSVEAVAGKALSR